MFFLLGDFLLSWGPDKTFFGNNFFLTIFFEIALLFIFLVKLLILILLLGLCSFIIIFLLLFIFLSLELFLLLFKLFLLLFELFLLLLSDNFFSFKEVLDEFLLWQCVTFIEERTLLIVLNELVELGESCLDEPFW